MIHIFSACCSIEKVFNLNEGLRFLEMYKNRKTGFVKAVKEMSLSLLNSKTKKNNEYAADLVEKYTKY